MSSTVRTIAAFSMVCLVVAACPGPQGTTVPINTADTSLPTVFALETLGRKGGEVGVTATSGPVSAMLAADDSIAVVGRVDDSDGVRTVAVWGTSKKICVDAAGFATMTGLGVAGAPLAESTHPGQAEARKPNASCRRRYG